MKDSKMTVGLLVAACAGLILIVAVMVVNPDPPRRVTLGQLATKDPPVPAGLVKISNCVGGVRHGDFLVFEAGHVSRYPVVFSLTAGTTGETTTFAGSCAGVRVTPIDGCPCIAPFVLVTGASAVIK